MKNTSIWKVVVSAALALICIFLVQGYWLKNTFDLSARTFDEKVRICLRNVATSLSEMSQVQLPSHHLINQISQDYYVVNIKDAIDANSLEYYLVREIQALSLQTDFEYGIYDCNNDQMVYGNYIQGRDGTKSNVRSTNLPTYDEFVYYFGVRFPDRKGYILANQWLPLIFTAILFLAVLFFSYATYEIFRQKKLSDLQKDFINNMTHEFKTPLTSIKVSSEVFLKDKAIVFHPRLYKYAQIINTQANRLNDQVERVLQIADLPVKGLDLQKDKIDLHFLVESVTAQLKSRLEETHARINLDLQATRKVIIADQLHLSNVLFNLLDNALKYRNEHPQIYIRTTMHAGQLLRLEIQDNGIGIDQKYLGSLREKFFRVPTGNIHNAKGFGLGLHYVNKIVEAHGWQMGIESVVRKGTTITIDIKNTHG